MSKKNITLVYVSLAIVFAFFLLSVLISKESFVDKKKDNKKKKDNNKKKDNKKKKDRENDKKYCKYWRNKEGSKWINLSKYDDHPIDCRNLKNTETSYKNSFLDNDGRCCVKKI